ncbi:tRNA pseudouridine synthase-like protein [Delitschia confertaspora ATCC 74209]|uniref:tRNA pseudouridine synthase 1 n=1 Tax=Delitschia confertaspora ATCC 74209 TaxID=1513339 RepID=A0A9P4MPN7_9PLEO|nr:tRNA pseudouridine synthase-like protein [Delitschia confertaspora ATCC 74209]
MEQTSENPPSAGVTAPIDSEKASNDQQSPKNVGQKRKWDDRRAGRGRGKSLQHGSRGPNKRKNMGRNEHFREQSDRRGRNEREKLKREQQANGDGNADSTLPSAFPKDEVDAEERRPKRKVAVMIGYSGTGYKGMQIDPKQKTIEGDLFTAFVAAGAISKANADDPKKSSLVRCARTDKGVHAAGNVISLKLIIEEEDIVEKINSHLSQQIRVWGIQRTTGSFSCYQACDSRWYEYLIPTHSFLPPHPSSFMGKKLEELAEKAGDLDEYHKRQEEVANFWPEVEEKQIKPILDSLDDSIRPLVEKALYTIDSTSSGFGADPLVEAVADLPKAPAQGTKEEKPDSKGSVKAGETVEKDIEMTNADGMATTNAENEVEATIDAIQEDNKSLAMDDMTDGSVPLSESTIQKPALEAAIKALKAAYMDAKKAYRISETRKNRVQEALNLYLGTKNYHNYTVQKKFKDPSAKRHIRSFKVAEKPVIINDTEWLSLKVHGQSFMMHQIRKMVGMAALAVRCGTDLKRIEESFGDVIVRIPKAPGLGLLLERPVFDSYNEKQAQAAGREKIDFGRYEKEIQEFKQREIYERIFREEAEGNQFNTFFTHLDNYKDPTFLYLTSGGIAATKSQDKKTAGGKWEESESENEEGEG